MNPSLLSHGSLLVDWEESITFVSGEDMVTKGSLVCVNQWNKITSVSWFKQIETTQL